MKTKDVWIQRMRKFTDNPLAVFYFLRRKLYDHYIADRYVPLYKTLTYLSPEATLNYIIDNDCSIIRLGDGEFGLMRGASVYFNNWHQKYDKRLSKKLLEVASSHDPRVLLCIPGDHLTKTKEEDPEEFKYWINSKILLHKLVRGGKVYGSSFAFYPKINTDINYRKLQEYLSRKNVIIITSGLERFGNIQLGNSTHLIEAPKSNSWSSMPRIHSQLEALIKDNGLEKNETLVMVSMGPAAKVLVYELTKEGFTAWDAGQFFDLAYKNIQEISS